MLKKNSVHTTKITDINNLGYGVSRVGGIVTFVQGGVTGDTAEIKLIKCTGSYNVARIEKLITVSAYRQEPDCKISDRCGGCVYGGIDYNYEKQLKRNYVKNAFHKAGLEIETAETASNGKTKGYRNKVQYPYANGKIGYYRTKSHEIIPCECCSLENPLSRKITDFAKKYLAQNIINGLRHLYVRCAVGTGEVMVCGVTDKADCPGIADFFAEIHKRFENATSIVQNINPDDTNVILGKTTRTVYGSDTITDTLLGQRFTISPLSFYQVNHDMTEMLYKKAIELAALSDGETLTDLYCGIGTIGLSIAASAPGAHITGVEIVPDAVANARLNAAQNGVDNAEFYCIDASDAELSPSDVIVVDPPRKGLGEKVIKNVAQAAKKRIVYVSCNPDTLARDVAMLAREGFVPGTAYPFDMFPLTGHVETVILLTKKA